MAMAPGIRRLYAPEAVAVRTGPGGVPRALGRAAVEAIREEWLVDDRWWIPERLQRRYFELALADGRAIVVFHCALSGRWYRQRA
jgi:hypothetical protein